MHVKMNGGTGSERELIDLVREKDSSNAFAKLYTLYAPRLFSFSLKMSKSKEDAEEIVQDAFVWIWNNRKNIKPQDTLLNLLFLHTRHRLINLYRKRLNSPTFLDFLECLDLADGSSTSEGIDMDELLEKVYKSIDRLPTTQRKIMLLARRDGKNAKEISQELGITEQTVRNQLSLATKRLKGLLGYAVSIAIFIMVLIKSKYWL